MRANLKILLAKWTIAVAAMARGKGKNRANAGMRIVPNPNPEKKVTPEVIKAARPMKISSIITLKARFFSHNWVIFPECFEVYGTLNNCVCKDFDYF
jgi:hypothetical protein